ncbi:hypothetical protein ACQCVP_15615 [Rossellomorea vietnamensis]
MKPKYLSAVYIVAKMEWIGIVCQRSFSFVHKNCLHAMWAGGEIYGLAMRLALAAGAFIILSEKRELHVEKKN